MTTEYKKDDKVVISVPEIGRSILGTQLIMLSATDDGGIPVDDRHVLGKLEDFQPAEEKIKFTPEEKKEFDELKIQWTTIQGALSDLYNHRYIEFRNIYKRLFSLGTRKNNEAQIEFTKAWEKPSRIEVIEPEHKFKIGDLVEDTIDNKKAVIVDMTKDGERIHVYYRDGTNGYWSKQSLMFIKSNPVNWEDEQNGAVIL
ncbi:MAG: hypothetical protein ABF991_00525 [Liquorilactobacillus hordei]|uniref:hypothetical protein n=1 Tax=Liquorilactobacillus hordei TaxID=468911 RepID=UPI0039EA2F6C